MLAYRRWKLPSLLLLAALVGSGVGSCGTSTTLPFQTVIQDDAFRVSPNEYSSEPAIAVIRSSDEVDRVIQELAGDPSRISRGNLIETLRQVDYQNSLVVIALHGSRGIGGYAVNINTVKRNGARILIDAEFESPDLSGDGGTTANETDPCHIVAVSTVGALWKPPLTFDLIVDGRVVATTTIPVP